ncbi:MAG TPA: alpha/beta hydrolase-fold protein, partial [Polyangiaceae bacterium]|nr:alpha/beta hydrolase-fold protein [Polyangiaceae bacterium]
WGRECGIPGIARVGSSPCGTPRPESDVGVMILRDDPLALAGDADWMARFGSVERVSDKDWGPIKAKRVHYADGNVVEFAFASPEWAATEPCDAGTLAVIKGGVRVVYDPNGLFRHLAIAARPDSPERHVLQSTCGRYERQVWFMPGLSDGPHELAVFLDAEFYLHDMDCLPVIRECMTVGGVPSMSCIFVSSQDYAARHEDYTCNADYSRFIAEDGVGWAKQHDEGIAGPDRLICGVSLSGLAAAYTVMQHPEAFSSALCQSGSFWWLADNAALSSSTSARIWLSVGTQEIERGVRHPPTGLFQRVSQIEGVESAVRSFESLGGVVHYNLYSGGHAFSAWREELATALRWLCQRDGNHFR